jgi:tRNA A58 N-methylase Trm61
MKYVVETGSVAMTYVPCYIKTGSGVQKLKGVGWIHSHTDKMEFI